MALLDLQILALDCNDMKKIHYKNVYYYESMNKKISVLINILNTISITSLIISISGFSLFRVGSLTFSCSSGLLSAISSSYSFREKESQHFRLFNQYSELTREINYIISKNNLSSEKINKCLVNFKERISMLEDSGLLLGK